MLVGAIALTGAGCSSGTSAASLGTGTVVITTASGSHVSLHVQIADDPAEREHGLMNRTTVKPYDGMAFTWSAPVDTSFWMKDTLIPLTVAFWDKTGRIVSMLDMPPCKEDPCPTYDPGTPVVGALEVPRGALTARGVALGDEIRLEADR